MREKKQNKSLFLLLLVLGFLGLVFFAVPQSTKAGVGNVTINNACFTSPYDNCIAGLNCVNGVCINPSPATSTLKFNGDSCSSGSQCQSGNCVSSVCSAAIVTGSPAASAGSCPAGTSQGTCPSADLCYVNGLCLPKSTFTTGIASSGSLTDFLLKVVQILLTFAGIVAVVMLVLGGYWYMAAGGNEEMAEKGQKTILNFVLGLVVIIMAYTIVTIISTTLSGGDKLITK